MYRSYWELSEIPAEMRQYFEEFETACGAPWERVTEKPQIAPVDYEGKWSEQGDPQAGARRMLANLRARRQAGGPHDNPFPGATTIGWQPGCSCNDGDPIPCTVLDPFAGSGTTVRTAIALNRRGIGIDLSAEYLGKIAKRRTTNV